MLDGLGRVIIIVETGSYSGTRGTCIPQRCRGATVVTHSGDRGWNALAGKAGETQAWRSSVHRRRQGDEFCQHEAGDDVASQHAGETPDTVSTHLHAHHFLL